MAVARLKVVASHGDETLSRIRFVLHGSPSRDRAENSLANGLPFVEGKSVVSTDLASSFAEAGGGKTASTNGKLLVVAVPPQYHLGYETFSTAFIDRKLKQVGGAPRRYTRGRQELALYRSLDVEAARENLEAEEAEGYPVADNPGLLLKPGQIIGWFEPSNALHSTIGQIQVAATTFSMVDFQLLESALNDEIRATAPGAGVMAASVTSDLVVGTIESIIMTRMRQMRWQGLQLLGYRFIEGHDHVDISVDGDMADHRQRMAHIERLLPSAALFNGELAWLRDYIATELRIMHLELDEGADPEVE